MMMPSEITLPDLKDIATSEYTLQGVLLLFLGFLFWALWRAASSASAWAVIRVDKIIDRADKHLNTVDDAMIALKTSMNVISERLESIDGKMSQVEDRLSQLERENRTK